MKKAGGRAAKKKEICHGEKLRIPRRMYVETVLETGETENSG